MIFRRIIIPITMFFLAAVPVGSVTFTDIETGADFLKFGIGARASAMGESFAAVSSDVTAAYWNPAGLAGITNIEFAAMHSETLLDTSLEYFGVAVPAGKIGGTIGINAIMLLYKPIPVTLESEAVVGDLEWFDYALTFSWGRVLTDDIMAGVGIKYIRREEKSPVVDVKGDVFAFDAGVICEIKRIDGLRAGLSITNVGNKIQLEGEKISDDLPRTYKLGLSYTQEQFLVALDMNKILKDSWRLSVGAEYWFTGMFALRTGYYNKAGNLNGVTYGLGVKYDRFEFDWANMPVGELLETSRENRVSFLVRF